MWGGREEWLGDRRIVSNVVAYPLCCFWSAPRLSGSLRLSSQSATKQQRRGGSSRPSSRSDSRDPRERGHKESGERAGDCPPARSVPRRDGARWRAWRSLACRAKGSSRRWWRMPARQRKRDHPGDSYGGGRSILSGRGCRLRQPVALACYRSLKLGLAQPLGSNRMRMKPPHISAGEYQRGPQQRAGALVLDVAASELATGVST